MRTPIYPESIGRTTPFCFPGFFIITPLKAQLQGTSNMNDPSTDWKFWQWVGGGILSMISGAAFGGWAARGLLASINQRLIVVELKQSQCQATLKEDIRQIVNTAITEHALSSADTLEDIRTKIALIADRLDRRKEEIHPPPHGERRDQ